MDEASVDNRLLRPYARAPRGQKIYANIPGKKRERIGIIGGWMQKRFITPCTLQGGCNTDVFNTWLQEVLLPEIPEGSTIIMDNAAFHKATSTKRIVDEVGCHLLFLSTYSPDLNPIEHCWHTLKSKLRPLIQNNPENIQEIIDQYLLTM